MENIRKNSLKTVFALIHLVKPAQVRQATPTYIYFRTLNCLLTQINISIVCIHTQKYLVKVKRKAF